MPASKGEHKHSSGKASCGLRVREASVCLSGVAVARVEKGSTWSGGTGRQGDPSRGKSNRCSEGYKGIETGAGERMSLVILQTGAQLPVIILG